MYTFKEKRCGGRGLFERRDEMSDKKEKHDLSEEKKQINVENKKVKRKRKPKKKWEEMTKGEKVKFVLKSRHLGVALSVIQLVITIILLAQLLYLNVLPSKYFIPASLIMLLLAGYTFLSSYSKKFRTFGKILAIVITLIWTMGIYYIGRVNGMFDSIFGSNKKTDIIQIYVLNDDEANDISDAYEYKFGILKAVDRDNTDKTIEDISKKAGQDIDVTEYTSWPSMVDALYDGSVDAIVLNSAYAGTISETAGYEDFKDKTKVLYENTIVTEIDVDTNKDVTNSPFVMYISGIDVYGDITTTSRSDVNILAVINPTTRQVLLLNTPRDYYVNLAIDGNPLDKLTHAGIYGIDTSMDTLGDLYGIDVDYYFRINFTGFVNVIDALGGISVNSDYEFTTTHGGYYIREGENFLTGNQALGFCRERYAFATGDNQRGKNQMEVISAIINTMASSALLNDFGGLMDSLEGSFEVSMSSSQISSLVRMQLNNGGSWNVVNYAVTGKGDNQYCYSLGSSNYVMHPDKQLVENAKTLINQVITGKTIDTSALED